ncbi:MAG: beta-lactamase family protein [Candidatus Aminicenantes bacterium]|nr:beta-lactamase family protein [Candidatus Aminicenantes bacterium]
MTLRSRQPRTVLILAVLAGLGALPAAASQTAPPQARQAAAAPLTVQAQVDRVFERWNRSDTPGCAVGVAVGGRTVLVRTYGMADLEHGLRITPETVFESGSVAKQFTAAAIALLVQDGKLSLDDPVRKHLPEVPDFGTPILIRHFLNHTSGLRSQWPLLSLAGRPAGQAVHTLDEILELVSGLKELNFKPGDEYLYNNTGYTLLGVIVRRVSGKSLDEFCQERLFAPLGMTRTQWRDDFREVVPHRAVAYSQDARGFLANMPFTNVIGNGGLLTTVGDLLIWNENLDNPRVGGKAMVDQLLTRGRLNDGFELEYAQGLVVTEYKGVREVSHGGSTAGYQTFLARFPDERLSVVVLSNVSTSGPARLAHAVADVYLAGKLKEPAKPVPVPVSPAVLKAYAGLYREPLTDASTRVDLDKDGKVFRVGGQAVTAVAENTFVSADGSRKVVFEPAKEAAPVRMTETEGRSKPRLWDMTTAFAPKPEELAAFTGTFYSQEIDTAYTLYVEDGLLKLRHRPAVRTTLVPLYPEAFQARGNILRFTRDAAGAVDGFRVFADRVRHLRFIKR